MDEYFIAKVAISNVVYHADKLYSYIVPLDKLKDVLPGKRVMVPFGIYNTKRQAMVYEVLPVTNASEKSKLKSICAVLDEEPLLSIEMLQLSLYMKNAYFCTLYDTVKCMIPSALTVKFQENYILNKDNLLDEVFNSLSVFEKEIVEYLKTSPKGATLKALEDKFDFDIKGSIDGLLSKKLILKEEKFSRSVNDLKEKIFQVKKDIEVKDLKLTKKQSLVVNALLENKEGLSLQEIAYLTGAGATVVKGLFQKGIVTETQRELFRDPLKNVQIKNRTEIELSSDQSKVYSSLKEKCLKNEYSVSLLFGVTGSGKTSIFLKLIDDVIKMGKSVIMMVPEIALTPQMVMIFKSFFKENVAIFHSGLSLGERLDEFKRVKLKKASIVIGTRSSVFAPVENLGLIVIDEEHEDTYKSDSAPRYHARDIAKYRCLKNNAMLLLASATPSVESFYYAEKGTYSLYELSSRYKNICLPEVSIVDMNEETESGNYSFFSKRLVDDLKHNLSLKKQSILLLNRRGYNTFVRCRTCDNIVMCPNCTVALNYHIKNNKLMCHHCGFSLSLTDECPSCCAKTLAYSGVGTQRIEEELKSLVKGCKILRMDADTTLRKNSFHEKLEAFLNGEYDVIIGTQMVAKGLNFPNVTLVGVISIDQYLFSEDFRSDERTFSLVTQVVGRSGRFESGGKAIIQTFAPESQTIKLAAKQDYKGFFNNEILMRKALLYPPFVELAVIFFVGKNEEKVKNASNEFFLELTKKIKEEYKSFAVKIFGPSPNVILKVNNRFKYKIIVKYKDKLRFRNLMKDLLESVDKNKAFNGVSVYVDLNPNTLM